MLSSGGQESRVADPEPGVLVGYGSGFQMMVGSGLNMNIGNTSEIERFCSI